MPVAIEFVAPPDTIVVGDTTQVHVRALNRSGDSIPGAEVTLTSLSPDTIAIPAGLLAVVGLQPGSGRVVAATANLVSDPFRIVVKAP